MEAAVVVGGGRERDGEGFLVGNTDGGAWRWFGEPRGASLHGGGFCGLEGMGPAGMRGIGLCRVY